MGSGIGRSMRGVDFWDIQCYTRIIKKPEGFLPPREKSPSVAACPPLLRDRASGAGFAFLHTFFYSPVAAARTGARMVVPSGCAAVSASASRNANSALSTAE